MPVASTYTKNNIIETLLRGAAFPVPPKGYISLHTGDPGLTGANEVAVANWPSYVRRDAANGGAIASGWLASVDGTSKNVNQILYPSNDGVAMVQIGWFGLWDAANGGNFLLGAPLYSAKQVNPGDVFVFDVQSLTVREL